MQVFVGSGIERWADRGEFGFRWVTSPPLAGLPSYPVFIDLAEQVGRVVPNEWPLLSKALCALAPRWEELETAGLEPTKARAPKVDDIGATDEAAIVQRFLACSMSQVLANAPGGIGIIVRSARFWDMTSLEFLDRLVREPHRHVPIAVEFTGSLQNAPVIANIAREAQIVDGRSQPSRGEIKAGDLVLALCPHGLPVSVLEKLDRRETGLSEPFEWPSGGKGLVLPAWRARAVRRTISRQDQARWHAAIFDAFPVDGWNYIRRGGHAIASRDPQRILLHHTACLAGLTHIGYDYLYRHLVAETHFLEGEQWVAAHLGAARLAPRLWGRGGRRKGVFHYRQALKALAGSPIELRVIHELANLYANGKTSYALAQARKTYGIAFSRLNAMPQGADRDDAEVKLRNGVALVDYKQGHDQAALEHEQQAIKIVEKRSNENLRARRWDAPLIRTNTAKLLIKRFSNPEAGIKLIEGLLDSPDERIRQSSLQNLGRLHFDQRNYAKAIEYLKERLERDGEHDLSESEELYDRFVFALSLLALGETERAKRQLPRMAYLAHANSAVDAESVVAQIAQACDQH